jgi:hypothetical protein
MPFTVILLLLFVLVAMPFMSAAALEGTRWYTQRAADAAALAGASQQVVAQQTDARGIVYCETVAVDPLAGPQAASVYWSADTGQASGLATTRFVAAPNGDTLTVQASVRVPGGGMILVGQPSVSWTVLAEARARNSSGLPDC